MSGQTPADATATGTTPPVDRPTPSAAAEPAAAHGDAPRRRVSVTLGTHLGDRRPPSLGACEELMNEVGSISHLARYRTGTCDFALDAWEPAGPHGPLGLTADERQLIGRDVVHVMTDLDDQLRPARTGDLVRLLLHTDRGALFGLSVLREQFLVALGWSSGTRDELPPQDPAVRAADIELAGLANRMRETVSQQPTDYGGWLGLNEPTLSSGIRDIRPSSGPPATPVTPVPTQTPADGRPPGGTSPVSRPGAVPSTSSPAVTCRRHLSVEDLHYVALCRAGRVEVTEDILDDPGLARFFDDVTPRGRRQFYALLGQRIDVHLRTLVRATHLALGSRVRRLVLDVEQGALFCYPVGLDRYLLAVTLDQHLVWAADDKAAQLAHQLGG
ncbi:hypothetical protein CA850_06505 [Micromonospora echinospora]|uniref:Uncharacterized protein n=1 Tax=Micromonospora echinospora TaxID=1877 RepID=A0A1C4V7L2_MICEC|nr:hypothetical protein [Micromonospora echinospora]OZV83141.1 hypothetical protein CA850_06505 [Micromonospora echinospora]SCE79866.1 hypothetical protein GA0070618_1014 [Micromonospora echinospora]